MSKVKPDAVVVELSRDRINSLYPMADSKSLGWKTSDSWVRKLSSVRSSGSLQLDLDTTPGGFPVVLQTRSFDSETEGQLVIRHAAEDKVDVVNMRQPLASLSHSQWLEKAFQKHRYRSETVKIWPAIEFMMAMANQLFPLAQRAFYLSVGNLSQSGGEFAAAARAARQLRCPIILGDVENEDLFDPLGALEVTREDSWWVRLGGPLVRPHTGGVDLIEALKHVFAGTTKPGTGARIGAIYLALLVYGFYLDEKANAIHTDFNSVVLLLSAMSATNTLVAATLVFLLTATRDELLFRALAEAARTAVEKKGHGTVVLVCGVAHVMHVVEMLRRGKRPRFAGERLSLLEEALSSSSYRSMEELRHQIEAWREAERAAFDADRYYDSQRTLGYTEHNRGSQETLTRRTLQLCSLQTDSVPNKDWNLKLPSAMSFLEREASASVYQMQCSIVEGSTPNAHVVAQAENILAVASSAR
ncbi:unnamed protein product [Durusdinium trenchii]|uniref:Uncharacterized protein n=1 Tax=Durusdinium trenchii TaxID=1381693 RepID=A0ABP0PGR1_9DINO